MSLILDALKRAERERRLEKAPSLSTVYEEDRLSRRPMPVWIWPAGALLVAVIGVGLYLWSADTLGDRTPAPKESSTAQPAPAGKRVPAAKKGSQPPSPTQPGQGSPVPAKGTPQTPPDRTVASQPAAPDKGAKAPFDKLMQSRAKRTAKTPEQRPPNPFSLQTLPGPPPGGTKETQPSTPPTPQDEGAASPPGHSPRTAQQTSLPEPPPAQVAAQQDASEHPTHAEGGEKASIPLLSELPRHVREKLGKLQINVHAYSEDPSERLIFINMKQLKVGDRLGENGPTLIEITPEGAVLDYGDGQVRLKAGM